MKAEYTRDDLKNIQRNPFYDKLNKRITIGLRNEIYAIYEDIAKANNEPVEITLRRCLTVGAKELQEHE